MDKNVLWSLRLGFSGRQATAIKKLGAERFLEQSFKQKPGSSLPHFLEDEPKTIEDIKAKRQLMHKDRQLGREMRQEDSKVFFALKAWWISKMEEDEYPLREKMALFWHNHFVATRDKVKNNYWLYEYNRLFRENAFGNFKDITKKVLRSNAMVVYLDNTKNTAKGFNENLSRELLELFTLGEGNYTEHDIKEGAKGLAGLAPADNGAVYVPRNEFDGTFEYFGERGAFKSDEMVDIIFRQPNAPYHITRKLLQWFIYDNPPDALVKKYGDYLRKENYEIKPFLKKLVTEEFNKPTEGSKIKDPLTYMLHLLDELNIKGQNHKLTALFIRQQGMDLFNQPNVKGWKGGSYWLTAQLYVQRNRVADMFCNGRNFSKNMLRSVGDKDDEHTEGFAVKINWQHSGTNKDVINALQQRVLTYADGSLQPNFEEMLVYDFKPQSPGADNAVMRLFNYMVKTPEFQII
ncbi:DUF1800 family protein [Flavobacterium sp. D11R37]|uniref:DUF1800 domain-containing protein n=1 Tax=Flavobacterium coralii TaxID=2838017 RepID=UPI001CA65A82|nr:DUF1800 domain-containing protein [Flavobacterium coralii]MBY8962590.1 DUF1800 family protein [Flavobacterium coralii]